MIIILFDIRMSKNIEIINRGIVSDSVDTPQITMFTDKINKGGSHIAEGSGDVNVSTTTIDTLFEADRQFFVKLV